MQIEGDEQGFAERGRYSHAMAVPSQTKRKSYREPTPEEVSGLRLLSEQGAIPMDQLARFLDVDSEKTEKIVRELEQTGCVQKDRPLQGDASWVWLRHRGARLSEAGFAASKPAISRLAHTRAINEARLFVTKRAPEGRWLCERALRRRNEPGLKVPDAIFEIEGERHAIEVELTPKAARRLRWIIAEHSTRYNAVVYFCSPQALGLLQRIEEEGNFPKLFVRALPGWTAARPKPKDAKAPSTSVRPRRGEPKPEEIPILGLIAEQGAIPLDQLAGFLDCKLDKAKQLAKHLQEEGLIRRERFFAKEPDWVWLSKRGARFSSTGLSAPKPSIGALPLMRATNDIRIWLTRRAPEVRWVSRRLLLRERGRNASVPRALVETEGERHAIEVHLAPSPESRLEQRIWRRCAEYDAVVCFCTPKAGRQLERLKERHHWRKLFVRALSRSR